MRVVLTTTERAKEHAMRTSWVGASQLAVFRVAEYAGWLTIRARARCRVAEFATLVNAVAVRAASVTGGAGLAAAAANAGHA